MLPRRVRISFGGSLRRVRHALVAAGSKTLRLFELARVVVRLDHVARFIVNADHSINANARCRKMRLLPSTFEESDIFVRPTGVNRDAGKLPTLRSLSIGLIE